MVKLGINSSCFPTLGAIESQCEHCGSNGLPEVWPQTSLVSIFECSSNVYQRDGPIVSSGEGQKGRFREGIAQAYTLIWSTTEVGSYVHGWK